VLPTSASTSSASTRGLGGRGAAGAGIAVKPLSSIPDVLDETRRTVDSTGHTRAAGRALP
jgi:hypothetical protein